KTKVLRFLVPLGRPSGLPDVPLRNCVCLGGFPRPIFGSSPPIIFNSLVITSPFKRHFRSRRIHSGSSLVLRISLTLKTRAQRARRSLQSLPCYFDCVSLLFGRFPCYGKKRSLLILACEKCKNYRSMLH